MALFSRRTILQATAAAAAGELITRWSYDPAHGRGIVERVQDVEPILEENKRLRALNDGYSPRRELRRVASIPLIVVEQWMQEGVNLFDPNCREAVRRKLNDPENLFLRTAPGRV
jgi:hypothetical protein